ncbi:MAG TPA: response regulator [Polyangiaceae bacterium]|nr:response regulator [Polyangiaceae bacterium]
MMQAVRAKAPSVLIVEDEAIIAEDLRQTLVEQGFDAFAVAASGEEALAQAAVRRPDVVLMDIRIQGPLDGVAAAKALRERFGVPIIYMTAHADDRTLERAKSTEPLGYLLKPVQASELKISIELALHRHGAMERWARSVEDERLTQQQRDTSERLSSLARMAAGVAHQINSPLTVVVANAEVVAAELERRRLEAARDPAEQQRWEEAIEAQAELRLAAQRIARLVANIQAFSQPSPPAARADPRRAVERAVQLIEPELDGRTRITLNVRPVPKVTTSEAHLIEVIRQLLRNAAQAMTGAGPEANEICVGTRLAEDGQVMIEVSDTGSGMTREVQQRIFEPFFTTKPVGVGTGLGLSICHGIVTAAGGQLRVDSVEGSGARFCVVLPAVNSRSAPLQLQRRLPGRGFGALGLRRAPAHRARERRRILVVDDEPLLLRSVRRLLPEYELVCVESARQALALLDQGNSFDLIVSDVMMPEMSGIDFYEALCARHPEDAERVIFVTGGALGAQIGSFLGSVPNLRLEKPFAAADLRSAIQQVLS